MRVLLSHQNFPGQYKHLAPELVRRGHQVVALHRPGRNVPKGVQGFAFEPPRKPSEQTHHYLRTTEAAVLQGQATARLALQIRNQGFRPDVMASHAGWGESLFLGDVFSAAAHLCYLEFYYHATGSDVDFERDGPVTLDDHARLRVKNANHFMALEATSHGICPTIWQKSQFPVSAQSRISVLHEGVDCDVNRPNSGASVRLEDGTVFRAGDPVVTYVSRYLEPYRGFPTFMAAMERVLEANPDAHVLIVGEEQGGYGKAPTEADSHKERALSDVRIDPSRVHFLGRVPYEKFSQILQVSAAHVYLSYPFVLSWSMLEAMAAGCLVIGSDTAPVTEVLRDGENGLLVDFFDAKSVADRVLDALSRPEAHGALRTAARATVLDRYDARALAPKAADMLEQMANGQLPGAQPVFDRPPPRKWRP